MPARISGAVDAYSRCASLALTAQPSPARMRLESYAMTQRADGSTQTWWRRCWERRVTAQCVGGGSRRADRPRGRRPAAPRGAVDKEIAHFHGDTVNFVSIKEDSDRDPTQGPTRRQLPVPGAFGDHGTGNQATFYLTKGWIYLNRLVPALSASLPW